MPGVRLVLLDRDGTINVKAAEGDYVTTPDHLELLPGAGAAIARLNRAGIPVAMVTNQRGVALGRMSLADLDAVHAALQESLAAEGAHVDGIFTCVHDRGACGCRKPLPGLLMEALRRFGVPPQDAVMIGDADSDVEAGRAAGTMTVKVAADRDASAADLVAPDLAAAVEAIVP